MVVDHDELTAMRTAATEAPADVSQPVVTRETHHPEDSAKGASEEIRRILRVRVPVIVQLARRSMSIGRIRALSSGAILEFEKSVENPLDLVIRNRLIGRGVVVRVGEQFGLRVTEIGDRAARIRSLGP